MVRRRVSNKLLGRPRLACAEAADGTGHRADWYLANLPARPGSPHTAHKISHKFRQRATAARQMFLTIAEPLVSAIASRSRGAIEENLVCRAKASLFVKRVQPDVDGETSREFDGHDHVRRAPVCFSFVSSGDGGGGAPFGTHPAVQLVQHTVSARALRRRRLWRDGSSEFLIAISSPSSLYLHVFDFHAEKHRMRSSLRPVCE